MAHNASIVRIAPDRRIESAEWIQFAKHHPRLILEGIKAGNLVPAATAVHVDGPKNLRMFWCDGSICCGAPTRKHIEIMFECAEKLGGVVVGPSNHRYTSIEDWEVRTRKSRALRESMVEASSATHRKRLSMLAKFLMGVIIVILFIWFVRR